MTRTRTTTIATLAAAGLLLSLAGPASADLTTICVGEGGAIIVPNDLVVPRGKTCYLEGTVVQGDVRVGPDADLVVEGGSIEGMVTVGVNAYLETNESDVGGRVVLRGSFGALLLASEVGDTILARPAGDAPTAGFIVGEELVAGGDIRAIRTDELLLETSDVSGSVNSRRSFYTDSYDTFVDGEFRSVGNENGSAVCSSAIQGESHFLNNQVGVQLGGDGPLVDCDDGSNFWGSDVYVTGTSGGVSIDGNIIDGSLYLEDNDPIAQLGDGNLVRGEVVGDFEPMSDMDMSALKSQRAQISVAERGASVQDRAGARHDAAKAAAEAAGPAF